MSEFIHHVGFGVKHINTCGSTTVLRPFYHSAMAIRNYRKWYIRANEIRKEKKLLGERMTYADIAAATGYSQSAIGHYFVGRRPADVAAIQAIADYLGVDIATFFMPEEGYYITDPKIIAAVKLLERLPDGERKLLNAENDVHVKRAAHMKHQKRKRA